MAPLRPATIVLDTNVVLDWLVFDDPHCRSWACGIEDGSLQWLATALMREEFAEVLARGLPTRFPVEPLRLLAAWDRWATRTLPTACSVPHLRCRDPDDQGFIDLAVEHRVRWLLTRDRALLALARHARGFGVEVLRPADLKAPDLIPA